MRCMLLTYSILMSQDTCLGDGATHSGLELPTSIKNQDSYLLSILQVSLKDQLTDTPPPGDSKLCHLIIIINYHKH